MPYTGAPKPDYRETIETPDPQLGACLRRLDEAVAADPYADGHILVRRADLKTVLDDIREHDHRVCWFTTCRECASLWDKVYEYDMERQELRSQLDELKGTSGTT